MARRRHAHGWALLAALLGTLATPAVTGAAAAGAASPGVEAETMSLPTDAGRAFGDTTASGRAGLLVWSNGAAGTAVTTAAPSSGLVVRARGDQCDGAPVLAVTVDGSPAGTLPVPATSWTDYTLPGAWPAGVHRVQLAFTNDMATRSCDRNLRLDRVQLVPAAVPLGSGTEAESLALPAGAGQPFADAAASAQAGLLVWSNGTAVGTVTAGAASGALVVRAQGDQCDGPPLMVVTVDGAAAGTVAVPTTVWTDYTLPGAWAAGPHQVQLGFPNDATGPGCDRNLRLDRAQLLPALVPAPSANPFDGAHAYVDPSSPAHVAAEARRSWDPTGASALDKIAQTSAADWYGDWNPTTALAATVASRVSAITSSGALPVLVAYDIPHRDCGSYSSGGAPSASAYREWVGQLAAGIGSRKAVVVLEPDALPQLDCLSAADQLERTGLLSGAVDTLSALPATSVYLDAGGATWQPASVIAPRLRAAGATRARGFSLDVSGYDASGVDLAYGREVSGLLGGGRHFVVDSSRNGLGAGDTWCNPAGRALGARMTTATGEALADALTWIKAPGESDGTCGGGPPAGQFWPEQAIGLAQRASY